MTQRYLIPLLLMLLSGLFYVVYIDKTYKDIGPQMEKANVLRGFIADAEDAQKKLDKIADQYNAFPTDGDRRLQVLLPEKIDTVRLIIDVNTIAQKHGMTITEPLVSANPPDVARPQKYATYTIIFTTTATYKVFREFLVDLERSLALRDIVNISFTSTDSQTDSSAPPPELALFNFNINITSYGIH